MDLRRVSIGFPERVEQKKRAELVNDFAATSATIVAIVDVEGILHGDG